MPHEEPVLIVGGGIAGLAAALALAKQSIPSRILEQRAHPSEAGAGIQIGPNGMRALTALGVAPHLAPHASRPREIVVRQGATARVLARMPLGDWIEARHGAPYWVVHRRDLQAALLASVKAEPLIEMATGLAVAATTSHGDAIEVHSTTGETLHGRALIGADGIRSTIRATVAPEARLTFSGTAASRTLLPAAAAGPLGDSNTIGAWLAPGAHVVHYPVEAGAKIAVVAIVPDGRRVDDWAAPNDWATLAPHLAVFSPELTRRPRRRARVAPLGAIRDRPAPAPRGGSHRARRRCRSSRAAVPRARRRDGARRRGGACPLSRRRADRHSARAEKLRGGATTTRQCHRRRVAPQRAHLPPFRSRRTGAQPCDGGCSSDAPHGPLRLGLRLAATGVTTAAISAGSCRSCRAPPARPCRRTSAPRCPPPAAPTPSPPAPRARR